MNRSKIIKERVLFSCQPNYKLGAAAFLMLRNLAECLTTSQQSEIRKYKPGKLNMSDHWLAKSEGEEIDEYCLLFSNYE